MYRPRVPTTNTRTYDSTAAFLNSPPMPGEHAIAVGTEWIDVNYTDRGADATLVCFHSALTSNVTNAPVFSGGRIARDAGLNVISVSDPAIPCGDVDLGWFLGTRGMGALRPRLSPIILHLLSDRPAILFGSSGGGYSAVLYGQDFSGHDVVAVNPRLDFAAAPAPKLEPYLRFAHKVTSSSAGRRTFSTYFLPPLKEVYETGLPFRLHLLQNINDQVFRNNQADPFVKALSSDPNLRYVAYEGRAGHSPISNELLVKQLQQIANAAASGQRSG